MFEECVGHWRDRRRLHETKWPHPTSGRDDHHERETTLADGKAADVPQCARCRYASPPGGDVGRS